MSAPPQGQAAGEKLFPRIGEVSSLPSVALQIIDVANDPNTGADDLLETIRSDPALVMRVMRTVNSSYYALKEKVTDLKQAIALMGFGEIRNLALTAYVARLFRQTSGYLQYSRQGLWHHMVATGMTARLIARSCQSSQHQEAYLARLLHDVGLALVDQHLHQAFCKIVRALDENTPLWEVERSVLGFDHMELGQYVAGQWNFPEQLTAVMGYHHKPDQYDGSHRRMVSTVALADFVCHQRGLSPMGIPRAHLSVPPLLIELGLSRERFTQIVGQLDGALTAAAELASIHSR